MTGETNRKMHEEDALIEEQQFLENLTKVELRESRALSSSLRVKLKYYGDEVARLRRASLPVYKRANVCSLLGWKLVRCWRRYIRMMTKV